MDRSHNLSLEELDRQTVLHPSTNLREHAEGTHGDPTIMDRGHGIHLFDTKGREYIDAFAGLYCVNIGYGRTEVADAICAQAHKLAYYHAYRGHSTEALIRLSDRVLRLAPPGMSRIYYGLSGSDANETNVKIAWYYNNVLGRPQKRKIIARRLGYHGLTIIAGSLTGIPNYHKAFGLPVGPVLHTTAAHWYRFAERGMSEQEFSRKCAADLDALIEGEGPETIAAFIGEPAMGTGGLIPPPEGYWDEIQRVLEKHDVLLIADEVVCGFGRTGAMFGSELYRMKPDIMTVAKGLTSAYMPLSGSIVGERVWQVLLEGSDKFGPFAHGYTYSAHPISAAAALANLDIVVREDLPGNAKSVGAYLLGRFRDTLTDHPLVGEIRGVGLMLAIELVANKASRAPFDPSLKLSQKVAAACLSRGMIVRAMPNGDAIGFAPPLVIKPQEADQVVEIAVAAIAEVTDMLVRDGHWRRG